MDGKRIAILGAGNLGSSIADGLVESERFLPEDITLTRRRVHLLEAMKKRGFDVRKDNTEAVRNSDVIIIAVEPHQIDDQCNHETDEQHYLPDVTVLVLAGQIIATGVTLDLLVIQFLHSREPLSYNRLPACFNLP